MTAIRRALVSVSDKRALAPFVNALTTRGVEVLSTGGTARTLRDAGVPVTEVSAYTGSPEIMDGRVKTLHPASTAAILMRDLDGDREALASIGGAPIDLVVVNLYPFEETLRRPGASHDELVDQIDIGGPAMVRAAAKNHARVTVVVDPADYAQVLSELEATGGVTHATRVALAPRPSHTPPRTTAPSRGTSRASTPRAVASAIRARCTSPTRGSTRCGTAKIPTRARPSIVSATPGRAPSARRGVWGPAARSCRSTTSWTLMRRWRRCGSLTPRRRWW
jgi:hypothetical protein